MHGHPTSPVPERLLWDFASVPDRHKATQTLALAGRGDASPPPRAQEGRTRRPEASSEERGQRASDRE